MSKLYASKPRPLLQHNLDYSNGAFSHRDERANVSLDHPARAPLPFVVPRFAFNEQGKRGLPLLPPSPWELRADASGAYSYYNCDELTSQWTPFLRA